MIVKAVSLSHFTVHKYACLSLPDSGVVVITGPNGSGKSSFIEAVSYGLWGKTLRGTRPFSSGSQRGHVEVYTEDLYVKRTTSSLMWHQHDKPQEKIFETKSKGQAHLESLIGSFDAWRRTCVFSSADASHFTLATDSERKKLLEGILGIDKFDEALSSCRVERRFAEADLKKHEHSAEIKKSELAGWNRSLADAEAAIAEIAPFLPDRVDETVARLSEMIDTTRAEIRTYRTTLQEANARATRLAVTTSQCEDSFRRVENGLCPTCGTGTAELALALKEKWKLASEDAAKALTESKVTVTLLEGQVAELEDDRAALSERLAVTNEGIKNHMLDSTRRERLAKKATEAAREWEAVTVEIAEEEAAVADSQRALKVLVECERVLGLKGVRANILGSALRGIESLANVWLKQLTGSAIQLKLKESGENAKGEPNDTISLEVEGAGGGHGYKGASGGERRRIDIAILIALSEVSASKDSANRGTLFVDEAFDTLDSDGVDAVVGALEILSKNRCVVVITHNKELAERLPAVKRVAIEGGASGNAISRLGGEIVGEVSM